MQESQRIKIGDDAVMKSSNIKQKTCYIYTRVSTAIQVDGYSLDAQKDRLYKEAEHRGYKVIGEYSDEGHSGKNIKGRPGFQKMLDDIRTAKERPDYVYVFKLSRFGRNTADTLSSLQFLEDYGVSLLCVEDSIDSAGAAGKLLIAVYAAVAEAERENIHSQTMAGRWQKAKEGGWNGGFAPYGYKLVNGELEIAEDEADLVREIFDMFTNGDIGINSVAKRLNEKGFKKKIRNNANTDRIGKSFVKAVLDNPVYAGYLPYGRRRTEKVDGSRNEYHIVKQDEYEIYEGKHEALISKEQWEAACKKRNETGYTREKRHSLEHSHILSGILKCPICGASLYGNVCRKKKKDTSEFYKDIFYYVCKNRRSVNGKPCTFKKYLRQEEVNTEVIAIVKELFDRNDVNEFLAKDFLSEHLDIERLQAELIRLQELRKEISGKKKKLLSKIAEMDADDPLYDELYDNYSSLIRGFTSEIADIDRQMDDVRANIDTNGARRESVDRLKDTISEMWNHIDELPDDKVKAFMKSFIAEIHVTEEPDVIQGNNYWVKRIRFKVPIRVSETEEGDTFNVDHSFQPNDEHVETVCLMSRVEGK